jgi:hypothetical protein
LGYQPIVDAAEEEFKKAAEICLATAPKMEGGKGK